MTAPNVINEKFELEQFVDKLSNGSLSRKEHEQVEVVDESKPHSFYEEFQFTWRAAIIGSLLGCLVAASNMYLGLKTGWTFGASLFGAIFSFAIIKPLSSVLPPRWGGGYFGPKENCTAQTAATTAGGLSAGYISGIPAMYKLGLLSTPREDAVSLVLFTISCAFYGLFFAVPLRTHFVVKQDLTFPTPRAAAVTIMSLHDGVEGEKAAFKKAKYMAFWFFLTFIWGLIGYWLPFFDSLHILYYIGVRANYLPLQVADATWKWYFRWDWPFFGAGLMTPGSTVVTWFVSTVVVYGIISPVLWGKGVFVAPYGFTDKGDTSSRFFLWPGIALLTITSFTELFLHSDTLWRGIKGGYQELKYGVIYAASYFRRIVLRSTLATEHNILEKEVDDDDIYEPHELVPAWWWIGGTFVSIIFTCVIMGEFFGMPVYQSLIAVLLGFLLSFVGVQATGETDINPTGSIAKVTQLVFARMPADNLQHLQKLNLMAGNVAVSAAVQSVDMLGDLKTGQLVGASPRSQFLAQLVASFFAIGIAVGLFILFTDAYPCIIDPDIDVSECVFGLVGVVAWQNVALLLTGAGEPLSRGSIIATAVCASAAVALPLIRHFFVPKKYHRYFPSPRGIGIAMINVQPEIPLSMFIGWSIKKIWKRVDPQACEDLLYSTAGGLIAGQGIASLLQAIFTITNVPGNIVTATCIKQLAENCP